MAYVEDEDFAEYVRNEIESVDGPQLEAARAAAERAVDWYTGRNFDEASAPVARTYAGNCWHVLQIDDCTSITSVTVAGTALTATEWQAEPVGARDDTGRVTVYTSIRRLGAIWYERSTGADIVITAAWGWPAFPYEVISATKIIGQGILDMRNSRGGVIAATEFGPVRVSASIAAQAAALLAPLRSVRTFGIA